MKKIVFIQALPSFALPSFLRLLWRTFLLLLSLPPLPSGAQTLEWVQHASGTGFQETRGMATDANGNVFVIGTFEGTATFGPGAAGLNSDGIFDVFFAKYNATGDLAWVKRVGGTGVDSGFGIALDADGNICIAGNFNGTADFDPGPGVLNLTSHGSFDAFLAKYDAGGQLLWAHHLGGTQFEEARCLAVDGSGDIVLAGVFSGTADLDPGPGNTGLEASGTNDMFFARYTPAGNLLWAKHLEGDGSERVLSMAVGLQGDIFLAGHFEGTVDFDPSGTTQHHSAMGGSDLFFARYDAGGQLLWVNSVGGFFFEEVRGMAVDRLNNVYITGRFGETLDFDPGPGVSELSHAGINDAFFSKYDASGALVWAQSISSEDNDMGDGIAVDTFGRVCITGHFINTADFDPGPAVHALTATGDFDIYLAQYDAAGQFLWAKNIGGTQSEESTALALDAQQNLLLTGFFKGTADFDPEPSEMLLTSPGKDDGFIAKYTVASATATHDVALQEVRIYPVPAADFLNVELPGQTGALHCAIFDSAGRMILDQHGSGGKLTMDVSRFGSGVYYLRVNDERGMKKAGFEVVR